MCVCLCVCMLPIIIMARGSAANMMSPIMQRTKGKKGKGMKEFRYTPQNKKHCHHFPALGALSVSLCV